MIKFIIIPVFDDEDGDLIQMKATLLEKYTEPDEIGKGPYMTGRRFADLIRKGLMYEADNRREKGGFNA